MFQSVFFKKKRKKKKKKKKKKERKERKLKGIPKFHKQEQLQKMLEKY